MIPKEGSRRMQAVLVIEVQNGFLESNNKLVDNISKLAEHFRCNNDKVITLKHIDEAAGSPVENGTPGAEIPDKIL